MEYKIDLGLNLIIFLSKKFNTKRILIAIIFTPTTPTISRNGAYLPFTVDKIWVTYMKNYFNIFKSWCGYYLNLQYKMFNVQFQFWKCIKMYASNYPFRFGYARVIILAFIMWYYVMLTYSFTFFTVTFKLNSGWTYTYCFYINVFFASFETAKVSTLIEFIFSRWILIYCPFIPINTFYSCFIGGWKKCSPNKNWS